ncbi:MAG: hypothetical protein M3R00_00250 [Pseudomonadota bacterium]|nr:hypothetical protein [Pseudomonadota bacterium]
MKFDNKREYLGSCFSIYVALLSNVIQSFPALIENPSDEAPLESIPAAKTQYYDLKAVFLKLHASATAIHDALGGQVQAVNIAALGQNTLFIDFYATEACLKLLSQNIKSLFIALEKAKYVDDSSHFLALLEELSEDANTRSSIPIEMLRMISAEQSNQSVSRQTLQRFESAAKIANIIGRFRFIQEDLKVICHFYDVLNKKFLLRILSGIKECESHSPDSVIGLLTTLKMCIVMRDRELLTGKAPVFDNSKISGNQFSTLCDIITRWQNKRVDDEALMDEIKNTEQLTVTTSINFGASLYRKSIKFKDLGVSFPKLPNEVNDLPPVNDDMPLSLCVDRENYRVATADDISRLPESDFKSRLASYIHSGKHLANPYIHSFEEYFKSQMNCRLVINRYPENPVHSMVVMGFGEWSFHYSAQIEDLDAGNAIVARIELYCKLIRKTGSFTTLIDLEKSMFTNINVKYLWRLVRTLHIGSFDIDGTLIHMATNETHDTPEKLLDVNAPVVEWAKARGIHVVVSGSDRQGIIQENTSRQDFHSVKLYSGSSSRLLVKLAELLEADFDGILMSDATNCLAPGTHCQELYSDKKALNELSIVAPKNYVAPLREEAKIILIALQAQHAANKYKNNPHLEIVLHFIDDEEVRVLKRQANFYGSLRQLLPPKLTLQLWHRNRYRHDDAAIRLFCNPIKGEGIVDPCYLESVLYMQNFSQESYDVCYSKISLDAETPDTFNGKIHDRIRLKSMLMQPLGKRFFIQDSNGGYSVYDAVYFADPDNFKANEYLHWQLRLHLKHSLIKSGFQDAEISLDYLNSDSHRLCQVLAEQYYTTQAIVAKISTIVCEAFQLKSAGSCVKTAQDTTSYMPGLFKYSKIVIDLDELLQLLTKSEMRALQQDAVRSKEFKH